MGKKSQTRNIKKPFKENVKDGLVSCQANAERGFIHKLSPQKRNELNQLVDKLLKVSSSIQQSPVPNPNKEWEIYLEIEKIRNKIIQIEMELKIPLPVRNSEAKEEFVSWLEKNGAEINGVKIATFPNYEWGLQAVRDLAEDEMIIGIPRKLMVTAESIQDSLLGPLLTTDTMVKHMPNVALALFLLVEWFRSDSSSFWTPYLSMLPHNFTTVMYFSSQDLQELKGSPAFESALKQCRNIARQYAYFYKLFQNSSDPASSILRDVFTYEHYRWATSAVMTRQNFVPSADGNSMVTALIPMWDIANHSNGKLSTGFSMVLDRSECIAWRNFSAGDQVFIFYGARSNADLLVHNGFVYTENTHDSYRLWLGVAKSDPLYSLKTKLLESLDLPKAANFSLLKGSHPVDGMLLGFLRVFCMKKEILEEWLAKDSCSDLKCLDVTLDGETETKTWNFLLARIKLLQTQYPTTLEEDTELLEKGLPEIRKLPIQLRIAEKNILKNALEYVQQRIKI